jgi:hypothetical protein
MGETKDETVGRLRKKLGREPTKEEIDAACEEIIRRAYADMALAAMSFLEENDVQPSPKSAGSEPPTITRGTGAGEVPDTVKPSPDDTTSSSGQIDLIGNSLDDRELFNRVALPNERYDDEWIEDVDDMIRREGRLVGRQEWDSGGLWHSRCLSISRRLCLL